jgi:RNA polymerase sigma-70 factor (ECF subfamily)
VGSGRAAHGAAETAEESEWIERAQSGDTEAFRRLVERHRDRAYGLALRILGSAPDAEEVAQDAFVRVWRALPEFRGEARFGTWLHRIVVHCAYDAAARRRRRGEKEESLDALQERRGVEAPGTAGASADADPAEGRARRLGRMLEGLTDVQRAVVTLFYYEDRSVEEVARVLELPANTVKTHLHRARAALRAALQREEAAEW